MTILGIDVSTKAIDLVYLNEDTPHGNWQRINLPQPATHIASRRVDQARAIRDSLRHEAERLETVYLAGIEDPAAYRGGQAIKALGILTGAIYASLPRHITILPIRVQEWRRELGLHPRASKADAQNAARALGANPWLQDWPQDAYDSWAIAHAAHRINTRAAERSPA